MKKTFLYAVLVFTLAGLAACNLAESTEKETSESSVMSSPQDYFSSFLEGNIPAVRPESGNSFYITDLNMNSDEWDSYTVGEMLDLDNDGEDELILQGPYGGMFLDVLNEEIVVFAEGQGTALQLSYVYEDGVYWIEFSDTLHSGRHMYSYTRYEGSDTVVESYQDIIEE